MSLPRPSSVASALESVFNGSKGDGSSRVSIFDYGDSATFHDLWLNGLSSVAPVIRGRAFDWMHAGHQILIVGNDPPDEAWKDSPACLRGINYPHHFSATSWLAAWKIRFHPPGEPESRSATEGDPCIAVIDSARAEFATRSDRALQVLLGSCDTSGARLVPRAAVLHAPGLEEISRWLEESKHDRREFPAHFGEILRSSLWQELTSSPEDHHALSNVLGALLLGVEAGDRQARPAGGSVQDYLLSLVSACNPGAALPPLGRSGGDVSQPWVDHEQQADIPGVVMIDDMSELWEPFLRGATGFVEDESTGRTGRNHRERFASFADGAFPEGIRALPERLGAFLKSGRRRLRAADLLGGPSRIGENFILFLDLRLFGTSDAKTAGRFHRDLKDFGRRLLSVPSRSNAWLDPQSSADLEEELNTPDSDPDETLLPRLLSLLDPTLPIVIFSSTQRSKLIDPFRNNGNLIIDFRKPILNGLSDWSELVKRQREDFRAAISRSVAILSVRTFLADLEPRDTAIS